jgi:NTE family protein
MAVSSNLTSGRIEVHRTGLMRRAMRASIAIPGVLPPVVMDGQVLVDGAVLKNFPTSVMRQPACASPSAAASPAAPVPTMMMSL